MCCVLRIGCYVMCVLKNTVCCLWLVVCCVFCSVLVDAACRAWLVSCVLIVDCGLLMVVCRLRPVVFD